MRSQWLWVFGKRRIENGGKEIDFVRNWDRWTASIIAHGFHAPVLGRSVHRDVEHDQSTAPIIGVVRKYKVLSRSEAARHGFSQRDDEALYALVDLWDDAPIVHVSPSIYFDFKSEAGAVWPAVIQHIAVVGQPAQQYGQPVQHDLVGAHLRRAEMPDFIDLEIEVDEGALVEAEEAAEEVSDEAGKLLALVESLNARIEELETKILELTTEAPEADGDDEVDAELSRRLGRIEAALSRNRVASLKARFGCDDKMAVQLSRMSEGALTALEKKLSTVSGQASQVRLSRGYPDVGTKGKLSKQSRISKARNLAREENISFTAAMRRVDRGGR